MASNSTQTKNGNMVTNGVAQQLSASPSSLDEEELGDLLYDKVFAIEPYLAPFITGMMLELGCSIVAEMVDDEAQLVIGVEKAKKSFLDAHRVDKFNPPSSSSSPSSMLSSQSCGRNGPLSQVKRKQDAENFSGKVHAGHDWNENKEEEFGQIIFERAEVLHGEHAPEISGMILEMDHQTLKQIVTDSCLLDEAIAKAHTALSTQSHCIAF